MIRDIYQAPHPKLLEVSTPLLWPEDAALIHVLRQDMEETLDKSFGIGLAAPQIGILRRAVFISLSPADQYFMINPEILSFSGDQMVKDGCLSVQKGKYFQYTHRPKRIKVSWLDEAGTLHTQKFFGLVAAVIHHEIDHLNGVLFQSRVRPDPRKRPVVQVAE